MKNNRITAEVISCPGVLGNARFAALQLNVEGFRSPYVLALSLRALAYKALSEQVDPAAVFKALASAVNEADVVVRVRPRRCRIPTTKQEDQPCGREIEMR